MGEEELLTVSQVAGILRVDNTTVRRWVKNGALEAVVLPHVSERLAYRIKRATLDTVLGETSEAQRVGPKQEMSSMGGGRQKR